MSSFYKHLLRYKTINPLYFISVRHKRSRYLGYYERVLPAPVYEARKKYYRENVLKPMELMPSLPQKMEEWNAKDPVLNTRVDIGMPSSDTEGKVTLRQRLQRQNKLRANKQLELQAMENKLILHLEDVQKSWQDNERPHHIKQVAEHYGIFCHMFDHGYFTPWVQLDVSYKYDEEHMTPVYTGNVLEAIESEKVPQVSFKSGPDDLWSIVLTNLDGHLLDTNSEYLQWFVGNIKGNNIASGETICDYLRPFPFRGTGYHRLVFILYKQEKYIDFVDIKRNSPCISLKERTFKTFDFYKHRQDVLTPAGLAFYQCTWDPSLTDFFHHVLNMKEPVFEYNQPEIKHSKQIQFPHLEPFNVYLDQYRDPKEIKKDVLLKRLSMVHPFKEEPAMPKYPTLHKPKELKFSWQKDDILRERLRIGKFRDLRPHSVYPQDDSQGRYRG